MKVLSGQVGNTCSESFRVGERYTVFADRSSGRGATYSDDGLHTHSCSGNLRVVSTPLVMAPAQAAPLCRWPGAEGSVG